MLLTILPNLYNDLCSYPHSLAQIDICGIPSLQPHFLNPTVKKSSPYGIDAAKSSGEFGNECDKELMNVYLRKMCTS